MTGPQVSIKALDNLRGAGLMAIHRMWKQENMDRVLKGGKPGEKEISAAYGDPEDPAAGQQAVFETNHESMRSQEALAFPPDSTAYLVFLSSH